MGHRPPELLKGHLLLQDCLDDIRPGHKHVARPLDHDGEVHEGR